MAATAESPKIDAAEKLKSFDIISSINLYRHDIGSLGYVSDETRQRVYDEELSYIAEGINLPLYTDFHLKRVNGVLSYFHNGQWTPYVSTLLKGVDVYKNDATVDVRKSFMSERAVEDLAIGYRIIALQPGERVVWYSGFPQKEMDLFGKQFVQDLGFQPARKMGFLYEAEGSPDGGVNIRSQSVDSSDARAFDVAIEEGERGGSISQMRRSYDEALESIHGEEFFAGRPASQQENEENSWDFIQQNRDLIEDYFMTQLEQLALSDTDSQNIEIAKKKLTYGVWAALRNRLDGGVGYKADISGGYGGIHQEVEGAYTDLTRRGEALFGCGGSMSGEEALLAASPELVFNAIFRNEISMTCPFCGDQDQRGDPCSPNQLCTSCDAKVENGKVVNRGRPKQKNAKAQARKETDWERINREDEEKKTREKQERIRASILHEQQTQDRR